MVKIYTTKKHRFNRSVVIAGTTVQVDNAGNAEISEELVSQALIGGFELVDKSVEFPTEEEQKHVQEVNEILESAKLEAKAIIAKAEKEAEEIILKAKQEAGLITAENHVDEKTAKKEELNSKKVDDLKALCVDAGIPEDKWKSLKKAELVELILSFIFEE
jgi:cell division septum initiation protein DivIVA